MAPIVCFRFFTVAQTTLTALLSSITLSPGVALPQITTPIKSGETAIVSAIKIFVNIRFER